MNNPTRRWLGVEDIKTMKSRGLRSVPRSKNDSYLELYMLYKEKERLEKELARTGEKGKRTNKRLEVIASKIERLEKPTSLADEKKIKEVVTKNPKNKDWKLMKIDY